MSDTSKHKVHWKPVVSWIFSTIVVAFLVNVVAARITKPNRELTLASIKSQEVISSEATRSLALYNNRNQQMTSSCYLIRAVLFNSGSRSIEQDDIKKSLMIKVFPSTAEIISVTTKRTLPKSGESWMLGSMADNRVPIKVEYIEPGYAIQADFLVTSKSEPRLGLEGVLSEGSFVVKRIYGKQLPNIRSEDMIVLIGMWLASYFAYLFGMSSATYVSSSVVFHLRRRQIRRWAIGMTIFIYLICLPIIVMRLSEGLFLPSISP